MYKENDSIEFIKGTHLSDELYRDIRFIRDSRTSFYEVICTKMDDTECHVYIGYDGSAARRTYNRIVASTSSK
jgi:hypothetical protein